MNRFLRALFSKTPAITGLGAVVLGVLTGHMWIAVGGALAAVAIALTRTLSGQQRVLEDASSLAGMLNDAALHDLNRLRRGLRRASRTPGAEHAGLQAVEQFLAIHQRFIDFGNALAGRFSQTELTYGRFLTPAAQVYRAVIDNLRKTESLLNGVAGVDVDYVRARLRELERQSDPSESERRERETLKNRLLLRERGLDNARDLLASNEQAMTQLVAATSSLANLTTSEGLASVTAEKAMAELEDLAKQTEKYSLEHRG